MGGALGRPLYALAMGRVGSDPWFGAHAEHVCSKLCEGCRGPYETRGGTLVNGSSRRGQQSKFYCQPPTGTLDDVEELAPFEVEDGSLGVIYAGYSVAVPLVFALSFLGLRLRARVATRT